jgi:cysteine desulfurase
MDFIYLDNAATTRQDPRVTAEINLYAEKQFFNASALYPPSIEMKNNIASAREAIMKKLNARSGELIFTSGATESNNMVIFGKSTKRTKVYVLSGEHSSVYAPAKYLKDNGYEVETIALKPDGRADISFLDRLGRVGEVHGSSVTLVLVGFVNSDTGTIQDMLSIVKAIRAKMPNTHIHCDATQAFCKIPVDVSVLDVDSLSISAHKIHGPKGIGALYLKKGVTLNPIMLGGGQQQLRPGTENTPAIMGFKKAVEVFDTERNFAAVSNLHTYLLRNLPNGVTVNGINNNPYITNLQLPKTLGNTAMNALAQNGILVGLGSACMGSDKSRTLSAMGISDTRARQVLRVSLCASNTVQEIDAFVKHLAVILNKF